MLTPEMFNVPDHPIESVESGIIKELVADNRNFKTGYMAHEAWKAFQKGLTVYCNCPVWTNQPHILNFPHVDYYPFDLYRMDLYDCFVMTDQGEQFMDARRCTDDEILDIGYFNYQVPKRKIRWCFDTVRHKNIDPRIRLNPQFYVKTFRIPSDPRLPLQAVKVKILPRDSARETVYYITQPRKLFPLWNSGVRVEKKPPSLSRIGEQQLARGLVG